MDTVKGKKTLRVLSAASFLNDLGAEMIYPIWPFFVTGILHANMATLGFIDGLGDAMVSLSQGGAGYLSDKLRKRKVFIWLGYLCGSVARIGYAFTTSWPILAPFRALDRAGKIRAAPRDAMIADLSGNHNRGKNFGILRTADNIGGVCGILFCIVFLGILGYKNLFLVSAIPSLIGVVMIMLTIKDTKNRSLKIFRPIKLKEITPNLRLFFFLSALFALATFSYSFLLIYAQKVGFSIPMILFLYLGYNFVASLCSIPFGILSDRLGRKAILQIAFLLWGLVCAALLWKLSQWTVVLALGLFGMHKGAFETVQKAFVSELSPKKFRASCLGYYQMLIGLCALPASLIAGFLWDKNGLAAPVYFSLCLTLSAAVLLFFVKESQHDAI
jgi:MFS family permease